MFSNAKAWWKRQWPQISTRIGLVLALGGTMGPKLADQLATVSPQVSTMCATVGSIAGAALIIWNETRGVA